MLNKRTMRPSIATEREHDITLIQQLVSDAERFQNEPEKFVRLLAPNERLVNVAGYQVSGRDEIYKAMSAAAETSLSKFTVSHQLHDIEFLEKDIAVVTCTKHVFEDEEHRSEADTKAALIFVMTKKENDWLIALAQNTLFKGKFIENIRTNNVGSVLEHMSAILN